MLHEPVTTPIQWLVAGWQWLRGRTNWQTVHTVLYLYIDNTKVRIELGWDGLSVMTEDFPEEDYRDCSIIPLSSSDTTDVIDRLILVRDISVSLGTLFRYCPWTTIPQLFGNPAWLNCSSLVSFIALNTLVIEPGLLNDLLGGDDIARVYI